MEDYLSQIQAYFNIVYDEHLHSLALTLINPNISIDIITQLQTHLIYIQHIKQLQITIIECINFDDQLLKQLAKCIPQSITSIALDFTGCESLRGPGFLDLFEKLDGLQLKKLSLQLGSVYDINDLVIEGLSLLLSNLPSLRELYLDFYENQKITEDGYLLLAQAISELHQITQLHLDLSANYNLTEDALQIMFFGLSSKLTKFSFKILDTDGIGGGSFFKLGESLAQMQNLQHLELTISTFSEINQKGIYSVLKGISKLYNLTHLNLNLSNINLPQKMLSYLNIGPKVKDLQLDISCNKRITFGDFLNLGMKIKRLRKISLNLDFCVNINEDTIEEVFNIIATENICTNLQLTDRSYSPQFQRNIAEKLVNSRSLIDFHVEVKSQDKKYRVAKDFIKRKQKFICVCKQHIKKDLPKLLSRSILDVLF